MSAFDSYSREQLRLTLTQAWAKHVAHLPLTPLEALITDVVGAHPEYQGICADAQAAVDFEPSAAGEGESVSCTWGCILRSANSCPSIGRRESAICTVNCRLGLGTEHDADHALMEALAEALWQAQRSGIPPDEKQYLELARNRLNRS